MKSVILDKCYLQGANRSDIQMLREQRQLVMSGALFYELLDTSTEKRQRCFSKLPAIENPVLLVDHVGMLLRYEQQHQRSCGKPSEHAIDIQFRFNPALADKDYELPPEAQESMQEEAAELEEEKFRLIGLSETVSSLFNNLLIGSDTNRQQALDSALASIADTEFILNFYDQLASSDLGYVFPNTSIIGPHWAHFRWLQVELLFSVDWHIRYQGQVRQMLSNGVNERLEHDLHDAQALALGILEGAFATREKKLAHWFRLLCPSGELGFIRKL